MPRAAGQNAEAGYRMRVREKERLSRIGIVRAMIGQNLPGPCRQKKKSLIPYLFCVMKAHRMDQGDILFLILPIYDSPFKS